MKIAYFNCTQGVAGDMFLAACIDAGVDPRALQRRLARSLRITAWRLEISCSPQVHYPAPRVIVRGGERRAFPSPARMRSLIAASTLSAAVRSRSLDIFDALVAAEARVHRIRPAQVHFHELNSVDTLVDIAGAALCLELLGIDAVYASPVACGDAAPATTELARRWKVPLLLNDADRELATPTGVAILARTCRAFGPPPPLHVCAAGFGAGTTLGPNGPSVLKVLLGHGTRDGLGGRDTIVELATNIDDMDPRIFPYVMERLFAAGARDVWFTQVLMKKGRPGIQLSALCDEQEEPGLLRVLLNETTTLGVRRAVRDRIILDRQKRRGAKDARRPDGGVERRVEYESARRMALKTGMPLRKLLR